MSNYNLINSRNDQHSPYVEVSKLTKYQIDDAICIDKNNNQYLGLINYSKHQPILSYLMQNEDFSNYVRELGKSLVIDFKNIASLPINVQKDIKSASRYFNEYDA